MNPESYHHVLKEGIRALDVDVCASSQMCRLLTDDVIRAEDFAHIDGDFLGARAWGSTLIGTLL